MNNGNGNKEDFGVDGWPVGFRFCPTDEELIRFYLRKKVLRQPFPPNWIIEVANLYAYHPDQLAERYKAQGRNEWFYFTNINNPNGEEGVVRVRCSGEHYDGYWKQTGEEEEIETWDKKGRKMIVIGYKRALVFHQYLQGSSSSHDPDKGQDGVETDWMMYEYRLNNAVPELQPPPPPKTHRLQISQTFILNPFLLTRKIIIRGYNRKRALPFYQRPTPDHHHHHPVRPSLKTKRILQEIIRANAISPPIPRTHHHNIRLDECCTVVCRIFKSSSDSERFTSSTLSSSSSPSSSSSLISSPTPASDQMDCTVKEEFTDHAHNPFVNIPHTLQNQQQQQQSINVHHEAPHTNLQVLQPAKADDASTSTSTIPKLDDHTAPDDDHTPHQDI